MAFFFRETLILPVISYDNVPRIRECAAHNDVQVTERLTFWAVYGFMRPALAALLVFGFLAWDMSKNHGHYSRMLSASLDDAARQVRWR